MDGRYRRHGPASPLTEVRRVVADVVLPPRQGWEAVPAALATWLLAHGVVVVLYATVVVSEAGRARWGHGLVVLVWLGLLSGLWARLVLLAVRGAGDTLRLDGAVTRSWFEVKLGLFLAAGYVGFVAAAGLGRAAVVGFAVVLALTTGLRVAGLDAVAGRRRRPGHYLRGLVSPAALGSAAVLVVTALTLGLVVDRWLDPRLEGAEASVEELLGVDLDLDLGDRFLILFAGLVLLSPAVALVCEVVAAVSRHETALRDRLVDRQRREDREELARAIHDEILSNLDRIRRDLPDAESRRRLAGLEFQLRSLQLERQAAPTARSVRTALRRATHGANLLGVELRIDVDRITLDAVVPGPVAVLIERLAMVQIGNSSEAGSGVAHLGLRHRRSEMTVTYTDDGEGFDPSLVDRTEGGLWRLRADIEVLGGSLWFERHARSTTSRARLPLGASES